MSTPKMWKVVEELILRYKLPFVINVSRMEIRTVPLSAQSKFKLQMSFAILLTYTVYCFASLFYWWIQKSGIQTDELELELVRIFITLIEFNCCAVVLSMHFVISFRPQVILGILNPIESLQKRIKSKKCNTWKIEEFTSLFLQSWFL